MKKARRLTPDKMEKIKKKHEEKLESSVLKEEETEQADVSITVEPEVKLEGEDSAESTFSRIYLIKKYQGTGEAKTIGFCSTAEDAKKYCNINNRAEKKEGAFIFEEVTLIASDFKRAKAYIQHQVRFMIRNELSQGKSHLKFDGHMCIEPNNFIKYVGAKQADDVLLFHNLYVTTLSVRTVHDSREKAERRAKEVYECFMMYYEMTKDYEKAYSLLQAKMGIKESDTVVN